jgi:hypothetical protein
LSDPKDKTLEDLVKQFNNDDDMIRIVAILSPSCQDCLHAKKDLERTVQRFASSGKIKEIVIWHPSAGSEAEEPSILLFNDESGEIARSFGKSMSLNEKALHVYLLYPPRIRWEGLDQTPPSPAFWMHQSANLGRKNYFDPSKFEEETKFLIESEDPDFSDGQVSEVLLNKKKKGD